MSSNGLNPFRMKILGVALLLSSSLMACEVTYKGDNSQSQQADANQASSETPQANPAAAGDPRDPREEFDPAAEKRARDLALRSGSEEQRLQARQQALQELQNVRVEVDISDRKLRVYQGERLTSTHDVAVGTDEWPTPTGSWKFHRVDINPEWNPPKSEEWAKDAQVQAPGSPENPMGRARLVYRMPNTVHGTDELQSLGKASSHGSIRVANEVVLKLAEMLLKAGGSWEGPRWFQQMTINRTVAAGGRLGVRAPTGVAEAASTGIAITISRFAAA